MMTTGTDNGCHGAGNDEALMTTGTDNGCAGNDDYRYR